MAGRRRRGQTHQSVSVSSLDMLEEEMHGFTAALGVLQFCGEQLGSANDGPELRNKLLEVKQGLGAAESSISNRLKAEYSEEEFEKHAQLQEEFFEIKANYFSLLRQCTEIENQTPVPERQATANGFGVPPPRPPKIDGPPVGYSQNNYAYAPYAPPTYDDHQSDYGSGYQQQAQVQMSAGAFEINGIQLQQRDSVYWDAKELVERHEEMQLIGSEMMHIQEAFQDIAIEADVQAEQIEVADTQIVVAQQNTKEGVKTLGKTAKTAKKVVLPGVGGGVGGVAGGVVGSVIGTFAGGLTIPGAVVGAAIGAGAGATIGHGVGMVLRAHTDKDMHKARLNENWQPDSSTKNCTGCAKTFSQVKRRHHCRNCGMVFCNKCTKHKMHIPGVSSESRPRVCMKCFEALMYHQQGIKPPSWRDSPTKSDSGDPPVPPRPLEISSE